MQPAEGWDSFAQRQPIPQRCAEPAAARCHPVLQLLGALWAVRGMPSARGLAWTLSPR